MGEAEAVAEAAAEAVAVTVAAAAAPAVAVTATTAMEAAAAVATASMQASGLVGEPPASAAVAIHAVCVGSGILPLHRPAPEAVIPAVLARVAASAHGAVARAPTVAANGS